MYFMYDVSWTQTASITPLTWWPEQDKELLQKIKIFNVSRDKHRKYLTILILNCKNLFLYGNPWFLRRVKSVWNYRNIQYFPCKYCENLAILILSCKHFFVRRNTLAFEQGKNCFEILWFSVCLAACIEKSHPSTFCFARIRFYVTMLWILSRIKNRSKIFKFQWCLPSASGRSSRHCFAS
jgi:hypothetical protein